MHSNCNEAPVGTPQEWLRRLNSGKLNKSLKHKIHLYSHLCALSAKQQENKSFEGENTSASGDEPTAAQTEDDKLPDLFLSPVILEDYTRPPRAMKEMPPLYFHPAEFFDYLLSDKWEGATSLRVMGGELLALILTALANLEFTRKIITHEIFANLNNRQLLNTPDDLWQKMVYEKMVVQLIYYEKAEMSNLPLKIVGFEDSIETPKTVILSREIVNQPYAFKKHKVDKSKLCPDEYMTHHDVITRLEQELDTAKGNNLALAPSKAGVMSTVLKESNKAGGFKASDNTIDLKNNQESLAQQGTYSEAIEYISEDVHLVKSELKKLKSRARIDTKTTSASALAMEQTDLASKSLANTSRVPSSGVIASVENVSRKDTVIYMEEYNSAERSVNASQSEEEQTPAELLNLTRNELYVTGLYEGNENNFVSCEEKLMAKRDLRAKLQMEKEKRIFEEMHARAKSDLTHNFKHLALRNGTRNKTKQTHYKTKPSGSIRSEWKLFLMDHEDCEMQIAKQSEFEDGVLNRLEAYINKSKMSDITKVETKTIKGKAEKNKPTPRKEEEESDKLRKDENVNNLNIQLNCSGQHQTKSLSEAAHNFFINNGDGRNVLLTLLTAWRQRLDNGVQLYGYAEDRAKAVCFRNVYLTGSEDVCSRIPPVYLSSSPANPLEKKRRLGQCGVASAPCGVAGVRPKCKSRRVHFANSGKNDSSIFRKICNTNNNMLNEDATPPHDTSTPSQSLVEFSQKQSIITQKSRSASVDAAAAYSVSEMHAVETAGSEVRDTVSHYDTRSKSVFTPQLNPLKPTISEQLKLYSFDCACAECACQEIHMENCSAYSLEEPLNGYPLTLGKLRKDYQFLAFKDYKPSLELCEKKTYSAFRRLGAKDVGDRLINMINDIVIRKEILSTSLGQTFTTVTFTKPNVIRAMTLHI